jgi:phospholipase C
LVCSDIFDHTSVLRFLETRFGAEVPNLSTWRRATVGDMTTAFNFSQPDNSIPNLPSTTAALPATIAECVNNLAGFSPYPLPATQAMPTQESGTAKRPSGTAC